MSERMVRGLVCGTDNYTAHACPVIGCLKIMRSSNQLSVRVYICLACARW